ncbi:MAG: hypothetical protein ACTHJ3_09415 [Pararhizobium sp.]
MYELFIMACMIAHPATCKNFEIHMLEYADLATCTRQAPLDATLWGTHQTNWRIKKWTCAKLGDSI